MADLLTTTITGGIIQEAGTTPVISAAVAATMIPQAGAEAEGVSELLIFGALSLNLAQIRAKTKVSVTKLPMVSSPHGTEATG